MARSAGGKAPAKKKNGRQPGNAAPPLLNELFAAMTQALGRDLGDEALDRAQEKAFEAMEARTKAKRIKLAREALAISPLCADGYGILAEEAATPAEALDLYRQAVDAGAKALGDDFFKEEEGHFWGLIETRPYMRARQSLAIALWEQGKQAEAVEHYEDLLRLNPNDNQGVRDLLLEALVELGRDDEAAALLERYKHDSSAIWAWSAALLSFRQKGDGAAARKALSHAAETNRHVAAYLLGRKRLPATLPAFYSPGDANEAIGYVSNSLPAWRKTDGALQWAKTALASAGRDKARSPETATERGGAETLSAEERIDDAVLALLLLGLHDGNRGWKNFDWDALDRLHAKGLIENPVGKAKSVTFTTEGLDRARALHDALFGSTAEAVLPPSSPSSASRHQPKR